MAAKSDVAGVTPVERLRVADLMSTDLMVVSADESAVLAWELMSRAGVHHLPIVTAAGLYRGVVDMATIAKRWDSGGPERVRTAVGELVHDRVHARVHPEDPISTVARAMLDAATDAVGVVDEHGVLVGLVTAVDLLSALAGEQARTQHRRIVRSLYRMEPVVAHRDARGGPADPGAAT